MAKRFAEKIPVVSKIIKWGDERRDVKARQAVQRRMLEEFERLSPEEKQRQLSEAAIKAGTEFLHEAFKKIDLSAEIGYEMRDLSDFPAAEKGTTNVERVLRYGIILAKDKVNSREFLGRRTTKDQKNEPSFAQLIASFIETTIVKPFIANKETFPGSDSTNPMLITVRLNNRHLEKFIQVFPYGPLRIKAADILLNIFSKDHPEKGHYPEIVIAIYCSSLKLNKKEVLQTMIAICPANMSPGEDDFSRFIFRTNLEGTFIDNPNEAIAFNQAVQKKLKHGQTPAKPRHLHQVAVRLD